MARLTIVMLALSLSVFGAQAQLQCDVTKELSEDRFRSSFRNAYLDLFGWNRGNNLLKEAETVFAKASTK